MALELAYALITPYTLQKSRTGAVLARLLGQTKSTLVAARMIATTDDMAEAYASSIVAGDDPDTESLRAIIRDYIRENLGFSPRTGCPRRAMMLVFKGENARRELADIAGSLTISCDQGDTIRNSYGDLVWNKDGTVRYFEPAILISDTVRDWEDEIRMWEDLLVDQPALLEGVCEYEHPQDVQQTLVLIKPDSWRRQSGRPGNIIDMFSRTGLRVIGCKLCRMSVEQAEAFYAPVAEGLKSKLAPEIGQKCKRLLEDDLKLSLPEALEEDLTEKAGIPYAEKQFDRIVGYMSGRRPSECPPEEYSRSGKVTTLAMVYEGELAVTKIRDVLGPTDPTKAPSGTVRKEFGSDIMVNTAHASDSPENAQREMDVLNLRSSNFEENINQAIKECKNHGD